MDPFLNSQLSCSSSKSVPSSREVRDAWGMMMINLFLMPGIGSWIGGHFLFGALQCLIATLGLVLTLAGMLPIFEVLFMEGELPLLGDSGLILSVKGVGLFLVGWLWSFQTSWRDLRQARERQGAKALEE